MSLAIGTSFARLNAGSASVKRMFRGSAGVWNADAADWIKRVEANSGSVSTATANAVTTFCNAIDAAGIRDKFYRLNLFCGTGLNACLVPLYRGPSLSGTQYGNTTDTNNGPFVSGDYVEAGGLTGTGNNGVGVGGTKHLLTGLTPADVGLNSGHIAAFVFDLDQTAPNQSGIVSIRDNFIGMRWWLEYRQTTIVAEYSQNLFTTFATPSTAEDTFVLFSRESLSSARYYLNGTQFGPELTNTVSPVSSTRSWPVFATLTDGNANGFAAFRMGGYSIGSGLTASESSDYYDAMLAFQTSMSRL